MSRQKWEISNAALKRIESRLAEMEFGIGTMTSWEALLLAMQPENFARPRAEAERLALSWIREGKHRYFCALLLSDSLCERQSLREGAQNLLNGIDKLRRELNP